MQRLLNIGLLVSSLFCYLEWADKSAFLFQAEFSLFFGSNKSAENFAHPFILLPFCGQLLLVIACWKDRSNMKLTLIGIALMSVIVLMIFLVGILAWNIKIILSTIPFIFISIMTIVYNQKLKKKPI